MTEEHLFAMVDDYISENIRVKIMLLRETETGRGFHHTITPHVEPHPRILTMHRSFSRDTNMQKMTLDRGDMYMWRTLYTVEYDGIYVPILDSNACEWLDGEYEYTVPLTIDKSVKYYDDKAAIREIMMGRISSSLSRSRTRSPGRPPTQIPKFVTDALKRDAIQANYICPITMDSITTITPAITSCYHIFNHESITECLKKNKACPVCREPVAFVQPL